MATKDFSAKQIRVSQLLASGGIAGTTAGLAIYSASNASNLEGGFTDANTFSSVGSDVFFFVSGSANQGTNVSLFGGDFVVSGTIYDGSGNSYSVLNNTLDQAYDQGGAGAGAIITADSGPIQIQSPSSTGLAITGSTGVEPRIRLIDSAATDTSLIYSDLYVDVNGSLVIATGDKGPATNNSNHVKISARANNSVGNIVLGTAGEQTKVVFGGSDITNPSAPMIFTDSSLANLEIANETNSGNVVIQASGYAPNPGSVIVNEDGDSCDFRVESNLRKGAILVDGGTEQVALLTDGTTAADAYGLNASADPIPSDIALYVSGAIGGKGTEGTSVFGGDVVVSGTLYGQSNSVIQEGLIVNNAKDGANTNDFTVYNDQSKKSIFVDSGLGDVEFFGNLDGPFLKIDSTIQEVVVNSYADRISHYDINFRVSSINLDSAILVDANDDQILIGSNEANAADENVGTDVVLFVSGTSGENGGKGTSGGATVIGTDLIVSGTYRGGYDALAGYESFQAVSDNYLFLTNLSDFGSSQIQATDSNFFFTGSIGSRGGATLGTAVFGGDVVTSGSLFVMTGSNQGIILESPNGTQFYLTVDNSGNLSTSPV